MESLPVDLPFEAAIPEILELGDVVKADYGLWRAEKALRAARARCALLRFERAVSWLRPDDLVGTGTPNGEGARGKPVGRVNFLRAGKRIAGDDARLEEDVCFEALLELAQDPDFAEALEAAYPAFKRHAPRDAYVASIGRMALGEEGWARWMARREAAKIEASCEIQAAGGSPPRL